MKYKINKTTYKDFLIQMANEELDFNIQQVGRYIVEDCDKIIFFKYNNDGRECVGCETDDMMYSKEEFINNTIGKIRWSGQYGNSSFDPIAIIIDDEFVEMEFEISFGCSVIDQIFEKK